MDASATAGASIVTEAAVDKTLHTDLMRDVSLMATWLAVGVVTGVSRVGVLGDSAITMSVLAGGTIVSALYSIKSGPCSVANILFELPSNAVVLALGDAVAIGAVISAVSVLAVVVTAAVTSSVTGSGVAGPVVLCTWCGRWRRCDCRLCSDVLVGRRVWLRLLVVFLVVRWWLLGLFGLVTRRCLWLKIWFGWMFHKWFLMVIWLPGWV